MTNSLLSDIPLSYILIASAVFLAVLVLIIVIFRAVRPFPKKIAGRIRRRKYISMEQFLDEWQRDKDDFPGCYCILIYDKKLILNPLHFDDIYIGQSVHVRSRVFHHLKGHGNGEVYYGLRSGCKICILITRCRRKKLNQAEKELIEYFDATSSINMTRGGSARR